MKLPVEIDESEFEIEVINIARNLWPSAEFGGNEIVDEKERDGIFITDDAVHLIECTTSRTKEKAVKDIDKLVSLIIKMRRKYSDKIVKGWFITRDEPTADQRTVAVKKENITALSYERFRCKIIDVINYKQCRLNYPFGSVRNPQSGESKYKGKYIKIDLEDLKTGKNIYTLEKIIELLYNCNNFVIQGHYGVGKSMTLKEIYIELMTNYENKKSYKFPIYLNLRDHQGQTNPVEAIERHARNIGFKNPDHLVRAWRAGYVNLILDGFDEIAAFGWAGKSRTLKDVRFKSMELIREFISQNPTNSNFIISGRINYFDSVKECEQALRLNARTQILKISDFTVEQVNIFLKNNDIEIVLPNWIPSRPLLLGYLVAKNIFNDLANYQGIDIPAEGWNFLIDKICEREALIEAGLTPETIREIIEGIASYCRLFQNGMGPIFQTDLEKIFKDKCGYPPDERALVLLQRLPGLAPQDQQDGSRYMIDNYFASVAKAGEILKYINNPYEYRITGDPRKWQESLDEIGIQALSYKISELPNGIIEDALLQAKRIDAEVLATDLLMVLNDLGFSWSRENVVFSNTLIPSYEIKKDLDISRIKFQEIIFKELIFEEIPNIENAPKFVNCLIGKLIGCSNKSPMVTTLLETSEIDSFEEQETSTNALLNLDLPIPTKVGLTILKKIFIQSGGGRQENALYRGLSTNEQSYVAPLLDLLKSSKIITYSKQSSSNKVWQPVKDQMIRIKNILVNRNYRDPIINEMNLLI